MLEHRTQPLLPRGEFLRRQALYSLVALGIIAGSLFLGMLGYHYFERLDWIDSFLNASMILGGMGPVNPVVTAGGKLFAGFYALYSGMVFLAVAGVLFAPVIHRFMHRLHLDETEPDAPPVQGE